MCFCLAHMCKTSSCFYFYSSRYCLLVYLFLRASLPLSLSQAPAFFFLSRSLSLSLCLSLPLYLSNQSTTLRYVPIQD
jgi:hypothetical protein